VNVGRQFYGLNGRDFRRTQADIGTLQVQHDFDNALTVRNTTRYGKTGNDYIVTNPDDSVGNVRNGLVYRSPKSRIASTTTFVNQTDLSGEFLSGDIRHKFVTGLELGQEQTRPAVIRCSECGIQQSRLWRSRRSDIGFLSLHQPVQSESG